MGCSYEGAENRTRRRILVNRALRMPLHRQYKVIGLGSLDGFDDSIFRTSGHNAQAFTHVFCGLMMA